MKFQVQLPVGIFQSFLKYIAICITILDKTLWGLDFERISREELRAATAYLRLIFAGYDFKAKIGKDPVIVQMQCINKGQRGNIKFQTKAQYGSISNPRQIRKIRKTVFISFKYTPKEKLTELLV